MGYGLPGVVGALSEKKGQVLRHQNLPRRDKHEIRKRQRSENLTRVIDMIFFYLRCDIIDSSFLFLYMYIRVHIFFACIFIIKNR